MGTKIERIVNEVVSRYLGVPMSAQPAVTESSEDPSQGQATPAPIPENKTHFNCDSIKNHPWMTGYDVHGDGYIDATDMATITHIDEDEDLEKVCLGLKFGIMLDEEVRWKLRELVAKLPTTDLTDGRKTAFLRDIRGIEQGALERHALLSKNTAYVTMASNSRSRIVERVLRAQAIVNGTSPDEPFGVGVDMAPWPNRQGWVGLSVGSIHTASAALAVGISPGDVILKVDGIPVPHLSKDGSLDELYDHEQGGVRGMTGPRGSTVELTLLDRDIDRIVIVNVERLVWSARAVGTPQSAGWWDASPAPRQPLPGQL